MPPATLRIRLVSPFWPASVVKLVPAALWKWSSQISRGLGS